MDTKKIIMEEFEHTDDNSDLSYDLLKEIDNSKSYHEFREHYTNEVKKIIKNNGSFSMTPQLSINIIMDVTEMIKKSGYEIVKK